jgi:F-type H+-transporting ATPase subunit alpha
VDSQVAMIYVGTENLLRNIPINKVKEFQIEYVAFLRSKHPETMAAIKSGKIDKGITDILKQAAIELASKYN